MTAPTDLCEAPAHLVEDGQQRFGRFGTAVRHANLIDARFRGLPRALRRWRLKEWQALQVTGRDLFASFALFDAKLMSLLQAKVYSRSSGEKIVHEWKLRPGAFRVADQLIDSTTTYRDRRGAMTFRNELARGRLALEVELEATRGLPRLSGRIDVLCERGASQVVSLPFEGAGGMYSHKGMFPAEGTLAVGDRTYVLRSGDALALLDDHKGYYPWVMRWDWVTAATHEGGRALGFNLTRNQCRDPDTYNENCAWAGDRLGILPAIDVERVGVGGAGERWRFRDRAGRVDLTFTPTVAGDVRVNAVVVESRYRGPFGTFAGRLEPAGIGPIAVDGWFGMGEDFYLRC